jgi:hypothetical protein
VTGGASPAPDLWPLQALVAARQLLSLYARERRSADL